ncbi:MAG: helix-turn-helix transcriptional regulator [Bacteroidota bacterium]
MTTNKYEALTLTRSSGNVFADIGLANLERHLAKAKLAHHINRIIDKRGLEPTEKATTLTIDPSKVSALSHGHLAESSIEQLISLLTKLGHDTQVMA